MIQKYVPECFWEPYPGTQGIIDDKEIAIEVPSSPASQSVSWSDYKNTVKVLTGITPQGNMSSVSCTFEGSMSDKELTRQSGLLDLLEPDDEVMANKPFNVQDLLTPVGAKLVMLSKLRY